MYQKQTKSLLEAGRNSVAGRIVKRKDVNSILIHNNQSQLSEMNRKSEEAVRFTEPDLKQYPIGELLLREDHI